MDLIVIEGDVEAKGGSLSRIVVYDDLIVFNLYFIAATSTGVRSKSAKSKSPKS